MKREISLEKIFVLPEDISKSLLVVMVIVIGIEGVFTWHHLLCPYAEGILSLARRSSRFHATRLVLSRSLAATVSTEIQKAFPKHV